MIEYIMVMVLPKLKQIISLVANQLVILQLLLDLLIV